MNRADHESTARINRAELLGLLDTMSPVEQQPITARTSITEIEAELARQRATEAEEAAKTPTAEKPRLFEGLNWNEILDAGVGAKGELTLDAGTRQQSALQRSNEATRSSSRIAALVPPVNVSRGTPPCPIVRIKRTAASAAPKIAAEQKTFAANECATMLANHPRVELTPLPGAQSISIHSVRCERLGHAMRVDEPTRPHRRVATIATSCATTLLVAAAGIYFLL